MSTLKGNQTLEEGEELTINLPIGYSYSNFSEIIEDNLHFYCNELKTDAHIQHWVKEFGEQNFVEWRVARTHPRVQGIKCCYRVDYRCQHSSTWYESRSSHKRQSKNVQCPSKLSIKRIQKSKYDNGEICTVIYLKNQHNHATGTATSLKYRDVGEVTKQRLVKLFSKGHSPSSAHQILHSEALMQFGEDYESIAADRNKLPDLSYCYNIFYKVSKNEYGSLGDDDQVECSEITDADEAPCITANEEDQSEAAENTELQEDDSQTQERQVHSLDVENVTESLNSVLNDIMQRVQNTQSWELLRASEMFCKNYEVFCKKDNSFKTALCKFGRYPRGKRVARRNINSQRKLRLNSRRSVKVSMKDANGH